MSGALIKLRKYCFPSKTPPRRGAMLRSAAMRSAAQLIQSIHKTNKPPPPFFCLFQRKRVLAHQICIAGKQIAGSLGLSLPRGDMAVPASRPPIKIGKARGGGGKAPGDFFLKGAFQKANVQKMRPVDRMRSQKRGAGKADFSIIFL